MELFKIFQNKNNYAQDYLSYGNQQQERKVSD